MEVIPSVVRPLLLDPGAFRIAFQLGILHLDLLIARPCWLPLLQHLSSSLDLGIIVKAKAGRGGVNNSLLDL